MKNSFRNRCIYFSAPSAEAQLNWVIVAPVIPGRIEDASIVMPEKAGHPVFRDVSENRDAADCWITRGSLSSGGALRRSVGG
jgi:hypothetical protein